MKPVKKALKQPGARSLHMKEDQYRPIIFPRPADTQQMEVKYGVVRKQFIKKGGHSLRREAMVTFHRKKSFMHLLQIKK